MDLEITKGKTTIDFCKELDGLVTIDMSTDDRMNFVTISLTKEEVLKVIKQFKGYLKIYD